MIGENRLIAQFVSSATDFLKDINRHSKPQQLEIYGRKLIRLASQVGSRGVQCVLNHHLIILKRSDNYQQRLVTTNIPFKLKIVNLPGLQQQMISIPPKNKSAVKLSAPTLAEIHECFWSILAIAITVQWPGNSTLPSAQIKSLMKLSGLTFKEADKLEHDVSIIKNQLEKYKDLTGKPIQKIMDEISLVVQQIPEPKRMGLINILDALGTLKKGQITPKSSFFKTMKKNHVSSDLIHKRAKELKDTPSKYFIIAYSDGYTYQQVKGADMLKEAQKLAYYLK